MLREPVITGSKGSQLYRFGVISSIAYKLADGWTSALINSSSNGSNERQLASANNAVFLYYKVWFYIQIWPSRRRYDDSTSGWPRWFGPQKNREGKSFLTSRTNWNLLSYSILCLPGHPEFRRMYPASFVWLRWEWRSTSLA